MMTSNIKKAILPIRLRTREAAQYLGVSTWTMRRLVHEGKLAYTCDSEDGWWRFDVRDLDRYVEASKRTA
jgi:excisionase family DNA binding protein